MAQQEIGERVGVVEKTVTNVLQISVNLEAFPKLQKAAILHEDETILAMHLACYTQEEIGEAVGIDRAQIAKLLQKIQKMETLPKSEKSAILHEDEDAKLKKQRNETILALWLACHTQQEIGERVGIDGDTVGMVLQKIRNLEALPKIGKSAILHDDFEPQPRAHLT